MAGKGSRRRPTRIPTVQADANYETIFGKYVPLYMRKQITDDLLDKKEIKEEPKDKE